MDTTSSHQHEMATEVVGETLLPFITCIPDNSGWPATWPSLPDVPAYHRVLRAVGLKTSNEASNKATLPPCVPNSVSKIPRTDSDIEIPAGEVDDEEVESQPETGVDGNGMRTTVARGIGSEEPVTEVLRDSFTTDCEPEDEWDLHATRPSLPEVPAQLKGINHRILRTTGFQSVSSDVRTAMTKPQCKPRYHTGHPTTSTTVKGITEESIIRPTDVGISIDIPDRELDDDDENDGDDRIQERGMGTTNSHTGVNKEHVTESLTHSLTTDYKPKDEWDYRATRLSLPEVPAELKGAFHSVLHVSRIRSESSASGTMNVNKPRFKRTFSTKKSL